MGMEGVRAMGACGAPPAALYRKGAVFRIPQAARPWCRGPGARSREDGRAPPIPPALGTRLGAGIAEQSLDLHGVVCGFQAGSCRREEGTRGHDVKPGAFGLEC
jgi:hypothetical protein